MILTLTKNDLASAADLTLAPRFIKAGILGVLVIMVIYGIKTRGDLGSIIIIGTISSIIMGLIQLIIFLYYRHKYVKQFDENRKIGAPTTIEIIDGSMVARQDDCHNVIRRSDIKKIKHNDHIIALYLTRYFFIVLPKAFVDQYPELKSWIYDKPS
jgi:hypothetical protein